MKKLSVLLGLSFALVTAVAQDQILPLSPNYGTVVKTKPVAMFYGDIPHSSEFSLYGEWTFNYRRSLQIGGSYFRNGLDLGLVSDSISGFPIANYKLRGLGFEAQYREYLTNTGRDHGAPLGFYYGGRIALDQGNAQDLLSFSLTEEVIISQFELCAIFGYQQRIFRDLVLDFNLQAGYKDNRWTYINNLGTYIDLDTSDDLGAFYSNPILLGAQFSIGYGF